MAVVLTLVQAIQNTVNTSMHITKTPHTLQNKLKQPQYKLKQTQYKLKQTQYKIYPNEIVTI